MTTTTLAARYNNKIQEIMPHMASDLMVETSIDDANTIVDIVFHRSEFLGGMAAVILALLS